MQEHGYMDGGGVVTGGECCDRFDPGEHGPNGSFEIGEEGDNIEGIELVTAAAKEASR